MAGKTKAELIAEIEAMRNELQEKEIELEKYEQIATCANMGEELKLMYDNYVNAGFTEEQAFEMIKITMDRTIHNFLYPPQRRISYRQYR